LLLFLISRSGQSAARDLVMENLWPDQPPQSALNSLHQTLFFLRRLLEPWQDEGVPSAYVRMEADVVLLNPDLFQIDSVAFHRQAASIIAAKQCPQRGPAMLRLYRGTFAPEFEYEPWAEDWRTLVHATFLRLADATSRELLDSGSEQEAVDLLTHAVAIDSGALDLRSRLVRAMSALGAKDAAMAQYRGLVSAYERELGEPPPSFSDIVKERGPM
jgi:DNA-binding SARP family transcriptional activator